MAKGLSFPIFKTKIEGFAKSFNLNNPSERKEYFEAKAGEEIAALKKYLEANTFVAFLLGKKNSGKGTYSKLFMEAVGVEHVSHLSVGDIVRDLQKSLENEKDRRAFIDFLKKNYRGFHTAEETIELILGHSQSKLIPSELIVSLLKYEIGKRPKKAIFIDGFPRALDQITYSLFLKELIGYRDDPDVFIFIDVPEKVIDERMKNRVICPKCQLSRSVKLAPTAYIGYDKEKNKVYLMCDNPSCEKQKMVAKVGDNLGIEPIRERLELDDKVFRALLKLSGVPKIFLRNSVPVAEASEFIDNYEITPVYEYEFNEKGRLLKTIEKPWIVKDDDGIECYSLLPAPVALGMIKQIASLLTK